MKLANSAIPSTVERVPAHTAEEVNRRIDERTEERVHYFADHPEQIGRRLSELDHEWDIERLLEANASALALAGVVLGSTVRRGWFVLPAVVTAFLFQHAVQGWCPPIPILRRLGFRTSYEIDRERYALKALRGDFDDMRLSGSPTRRARRALEAARSA